jgi:hypothetical protein
VQTYKTASTDTSSEQHFHNTIQLFEVVDKFFSLSAHSPGLMDVIPRRSLREAIVTKAICMARPQKTPESAQQQSLHQAARRELLLFLSGPYSEGDCAMLGTWVGFFQDEAMALTLIQHWQPLVKKYQVNFHFFRAQTYSRYGRHREAYSNLKEAIKLKTEADTFDNWTILIAARLARSSVLSENERQEMLEALLASITRRWKKGDYAYRYVNERDFDPQGDVHALLERPELKNLYDRIRAHPKGEPKGESKK